MVINTTVRCFVLFKRQMLMTLLQVPVFLKNVIKPACIGKSGGPYQNISILVVRSDIPLRPKHTIIVNS
jgi:hypothetical protein